MTAILVSIQQDNAHGARLEGLDHRLKGAQRLKEKIAEKIGVKADAGVSDVAGRIKDAVRYTFSLEQDRYVEGYWDLKERLESAGCRMAHCRNRWRDDPEYKGINSTWHAPGGGLFELQFHTLESYDAKENRTHRSYDRRRSADYQPCPSSGS